MKRPVELIRFEIMKDIEKYSSQTEPTLLKVLEEYIELIDDLYLEDERKLMVHSFFQGVRYGRDNRKIKSKGLVRRNNKKQ